MDLRGHSTNSASLARHDLVVRAVSAVCPDLRVKHGPFAGMRYAEPRSIGGPLFPRLFGSYESELAAVMEEACQRGYGVFVNVGCGEGYYAVGFALRVPRAIVFAYDTDPEALMLCRRMARLNGVGDRVVTGDFCDIDRLTAVTRRGRAFILSDCEGYEAALFVPRCALALLKHDLVVEIHDFIDPAIPSTLKAVFRDTHDLTIVTTTPNECKVAQCDDHELRRFDGATRAILLSEGRPQDMSWFVFRAREDDFRSTRG